jgi:mono/diheme cytochrome c family protein
MANKDARFFCALITAFLTLCLNASAEGADNGRGKLLYENHCLDCHESTVHVRDNHKAKSIDELRAEVIRWAGNQKLKWGPTEINDVTGYLDESFYHYGRTTD